MHIDDWNDVFLSKLDTEDIVSTLKNAGTQNIVVKGKPHTGLCYWPCSIGRMHRGLKGRDYIGEMIELCHTNGIDVIVYYSQIFDNWAYDNHPSWRCVYVDGLSSKEKAHHFFKKGRYGVVCPNNVEYREYVKANLQELNRNYKFEGMFLDMPFWPEVCYCMSCRERYLKESGKELPRVVDWNDTGWKEFQYAREKWMGEFAAFSTGCIKEINPEVTVEHNFAVALFPWQFANTDFVMDACDYAGGDYYGGYLQQTFACKYYKNVSPNLPFSYITSRCDPDLVHHTTTKTREELLLHAITALVHNGAFSICDGMNPDGTICNEAYDDVIKKVFDDTGRYEKYVNGKLLSNVSIWFATHSKFEMTGNGESVSEQKLDIEGFAEGKVKMAAILRENNIPFEVVASRNLKDIRDDVLVISDTISIRDDEMDAIEEYVKSGGNLYISGFIGHKKLLELLEIDYKGMTEHSFTYMNPAEKGKAVFEGFNEKNPLTVNSSQHIVKIKGQCDVLATITLPYTLTDTEQFASIHSNPPGIATDMPAVVLKNIGKGRIMWLAASIEKSKPYMSRKVVNNLVKYLCSELKFTSNAPAFVEILGWEKDGRRYYAAINQQEVMPISPVYDVFIEVPGKIDKARRLDNGGEIAVMYDGKKSRIELPKIDIFLMIEVE
jgi:Beta-galactosidase